MRATVRSLSLIQRLPLGFTQRPLAKLELPHRELGLGAVAPESGTLRGPGTNSKPLVPSRRFVLQRSQPITERKSSLAGSNR